MFSLRLTRILEILIHLQLFMDLATELNNGIETRGGKGKKKQPTLTCQISLYIDVHTRT
jgi:hypothetical protein